MTNREQRFYIPRGQENWDVTVNEQLNTFANKTDLQLEQERATWRAAVAAEAMNRHHAFQGIWKWAIWVGALVGIEGVNIVALWVFK